LLKIEKCDNGYNVTERKAHLLFSFCLNCEFSSCFISRELFIFRGLSYLKNCSFLHVPHFWLLPLRNSQNWSSFNLLMLSHCRSHFASWSKSYSSPRSQFQDRLMSRISSVFGFTDFRFHLVSNFVFNLYRCSIFSTDHLPNLFFNRVSIFGVEHVSNFVSDGISHFLPHLVSNCLSDLVSHWVSPHLSHCWILSHDDADGENIWNSLVGQSNNLSLKPGRKWNSKDNAIWKSEHDKVRYLRHDE
jgi:hypothetical protein